MTRHVPTYQLYGDKHAESADFWLHCESIPERSRLHDWEIRPHRHAAFFQILYISNGNGEALMNRAYRRFDAPAAIFVPPGAVHGFRFSPDISGLVVTVLRDRLDRLTAGDRNLAAFARTPHLLADADDVAPRAVDALARIAAELAGHALGRWTMLDALVTAALIEFARAGATHAGQTPPPDGLDRGRMEALGALIGAHFREHRPVGFYADRLGISAAHLNRIARRATGRSVSQLLTLRLVEEARRDLVFTFLPAQSIALSLGFSDPAYFSRFFRKQTGLTPGAFRERERARLKF
ncbi:helix-turn-helix domain-containing protein [Nitratireductor sp. CAU 1489]|uniref:Helix-turn-helix domain-containing protein n=1 Tax=Nitratireductor arenosus TaxID=2682096 RepID=A0A844QCT0_9HYPH|nr:helix-turn-helix domain-containing protein [Nitratireductor arenosus]MVA97072.1 helix-turn-helix domain-containing protein [Nitratireductor arenosus]